MLNKAFKVFMGLVTAAAMSGSFGVRQHHRTQFKLAPRRM